MPKRSSKDENQLAKSIVDEVIKETEDDGWCSTLIVKNPAAVALGKLGGLKGGKARDAKLSDERKKEIARMGAKARWHPKT